MRPKILDLCCKAGGAAMGYHRAGFEVVGVDHEPQPNYPFKFHQADAIEYLKAHWHEFDAAHASPPCQAYSTKTPDQSKHPQLIEPIRKALLDTGLPYIIENVENAPLIDPIRLCGSSFGLRVRRHRLFESNFLLTAPPCDHGWQDADKCFDIYDHKRWYKSGIVHVFGTGGGKSAEHWPEAMGIDWMKRHEIAEAIPPAFTEYLGRQLFEHLMKIQAKAA